MSAFQGGQTSIGKGLLAELGPLTGSPSHPRRRGPGLRIRMKRIHGVTSSAVLRTPYYFQCPPLEEFRVTHSFEHTKYSALDGEYSRPGGPNLINVPLRTLVVEYGAYVVEHDYDVQKLVSALLRIHDKGEPFDLLMTHNYNDEPELHIDAVLTSVDVVENAGERDARYLELSFDEFRDPVTKAKGEKKRRRGRSKLPFTIQLNKDGSYRGIKAHGEDLTLAVIAKYAYGKPSWARFVAQANKLNDWGVNTPLIKHARFRKHGGKIKVPDVELVGRAAPGIGGAPAGDGFSGG